MKDYLCAYMKMRYDLLGFFKESFIKMHLFLYLIHLIDYFIFPIVELKIQPSLNSILIPPHLRSSPCSASEGSEDCSAGSMTAEASNSIPMVGATAATDPQPCTSATS